LTLPKIVLHCSCAMAPCFVVEGGHRLSGTVRPAGNKNAALPILAATLLADGPCVLDNVPRIRDVETLLELLVAQGVTAAWEGDHTLTLDARHAKSTDPDPALCAKIRASVLLAGPMLARFGRVRLT
jgi:UDP-N-acetylglucosamine 1-carboxyvinyltransferase